MERVRYALEFGDAALAFGAAAFAIAALARLGTPFRIYGDVFGGRGAPMAAAADPSPLAVLRHLEDGRGIASGGAPCNQRTDPDCLANPDCSDMMGGPPENTDLGVLNRTRTEAFRDSRGCLESWTNPVYVDWRNGGFEAGTSAYPYNTIEEGIRFVPVGGEVIISNGTYSGERRFPAITRILTKAMTLNKASGGGSAIIE